MALWPGLLKGPVCLVYGLETHFRVRARVDIRMTLFRAAMESRAEVAGRCAGQSPDMHNIPSGLVRTSPLGQAIDGAYGALYAGLPRPQGPTSRGHCVGNLTALTIASGRQIVCLIICSPSDCCPPATALAREYSPCPCTNEDVPLETQSLGTSSVAHEQTFKPPWCEMRSAAFDAKRANPALGFDRLGYGAMQSVRARASLTRVPHPRLSDPVRAPCGSERHRRVGQVEPEKADHRTTPQ
jgi:hypothetical protein